jgi:anti-sigma-K factor RskA
MTLVVAREKLESVEAAFRIGLEAVFQHLFVRRQVMRAAVYSLSAVMLVALAAAIFAPGTSDAQPATRPTDLWIALSSDTADGRQQVVVIDPRSHVMSVYHVDKASGVITLKSVRNIQADLMMDEFNTENPLPREIRAILNQR